MQKLMKNQIFTMVGCFLMTVLAVLLFLDGFDAGGLHVADRMLHLVMAVALVIYTVFALFPLVVRYGGILRVFVLIEVGLVLVAAVLHACMEWTTISFLYKTEICAVLGLALWLRATVEILHAYLGDPTERAPIWRMLAYILLAALGVWQMASPLITDEILLFTIGTAAGVMALLLACASISNYRASAPARAAKKQEKAAQAAETAASPEQAQVALVEHNEENTSKEEE